MPERRTAGTRMQSRVVDPERFRTSDGVGPCQYFGDPGYDSPAEAERAWRHVRRRVWADTHRFHLPVAAMTYDGLSRGAWPLLWGAWAYQHFDAGPILERLADDEAAVRRFETKDPRGAAAIADFLSLWRDDLATMRACTEECARVPDDWSARLNVGVTSRINSAFKYGSLAGPDHDA